MNMKKTLTDWADENDVILVFFDGLEDAIVGLATVFTTQPARVVYSYRKILDILVRDSDMTREEADEFFSFNIEGAWVGDATPAILYDHEDF
jgi:hypothetical protein